MRRDDSSRNCILDLEIQILYNANAACLPIITKCRPMSLYNIFQPPSLPASMYVRVLSVFQESPFPMPTTDIQSALLMYCAKYKSYTFHSNVA